MILIDLFINALEILRIAGRLVLRPFRRVEQLTSFTVNLDDTEAKWESEALDEWDQAFNEATGSFPEFSRLALEEKLAIQSRFALRALPQNTGDFMKFENCHLESAGGRGFYVAPNHVVLEGSGLGAPIRVSAPGPVASGDEIERYRQLMAAKGVVWAGRE